MSRTNTPEVRTEDRGRLASGQDSHEECVLIKGRRRRREWEERWSWYKEQGGIAVRRQVPVQLAVCATPVRHGSHLSHSSHIRSWSVGDSPPKLTCDSAVTSSIYLPAWPCCLSSASAASCAAFAARVPPTLHSTLYCRRIALSCSVSRTRNVISYPRATMASQQLQLSDVVESIRRKRAQNANRKPPRLPMENSTDG
jgi:hypothetical protein